MPVHAPPNDAEILAIQRPDPKLWKYYLIQCLAFPPAFPFVVLPTWFKYQTLRYTFTEEGISMRWGILFRRETIIQYARIQDIHLRSNVVERWLGLARILVQTASGNASAEMTLEGLPQYEAIRDFLYARMRGVKGPKVAVNASAVTSQSAAGDHDVARILQEAVEEIRQLRLAVEQRQSSERGGLRDV